MAQLIAKKPSPLKKLRELGQSPWLDHLERNLLRSGELAAMIEHWGICGITSNPAIFEKAIGRTQQYDERIAVLARDGRSTAEIYETLVLEDIGAAADALLDTHAASGGRDGFVCLEVSPHLANDAAGTVAEGERWWAALARPNVMIKVPATAGGLAAIRELTARGINVNVTLLFSLERYQEVTDAFIGGLEEVARAGRDVERLASVASFFLSRIDSMIDARLEPMIAEKGRYFEQARGLRGEIAIASAKRAYSIFEQVFGSKRFRKLSRHGAQPQRLLWASTGTKNPQYSDIKYIEPLIGPGTVSTMPLETLRAYDDHGEPAVRLKDDQAPASAVLKTLATLGIDLREVTDRLLDEGIEKFVQPFDTLFEVIDAKRRARSRGTP